MFQGLCVIQEGYACSRFIVEQLLVLQRHSDANNWWGWLILICGRSAVILIA
jgi:hypothetical protein